MQLDLFLKPSPPRQKPPTWENLSRKQKSTLVATIARLMAKIVHPQHTGAENER
jgi:hypothetical protein